MFCFCCSDLLHDSKCSLTSLGLVFLSETLLSLLLKYWFLFILQNMIIGLKHISRYNQGSSRDNVSSKFLLQISDTSFWNCFSFCGIKDLSFSPLTFHDLKLILNDILWYIFLIQHSYWVNIQIISFKNSIADRPTWISMVLNTIT